MTLAIADLTDYSSVVATVDGEPGFDLTNRVIRGRDVVAEYVLRSWCSPRGSMVWAPGQGEDVTRLENSSADATTLARWRMRLMAQAKRASGFVVNCAMTIAYDNPRRAFGLVSVLTLTDGSKLGLDVTISQASGAILSISKRAIV